MSLNTNNKNLEYIPLSEAGKILNTSRDYMNVLVRRGKLRAVKLGRNWVTTMEWIEQYKGLKVSEFNGAQDLEKAEKDELRILKSSLILEREKVLEAKARIPEIKLTSRELQNEERKNIFEAAQKQFRKIDAEELEKASKRYGILKSLRQRFGIRFAVVSGMATILLTVAIGFTGMNVSQFKDFNISKYQASILSDVFKNFPDDIPFFYRWLADNVSRSLAFLKLKTSSELAVGELSGGKSKIKIAEPSETFARIDTLAEAETLDAFGPGEFLAKEGEEGLPAEALAKEGEFTLIENRLSVVEAGLAEQKAITGAELSLQKKTILGTLETLIGISKLLPVHPISTIVVQGSPATLTTYSVQPQVNTGFDRLSADYFTLAHDATINGHLTVKSGGEFNTLSVSGATTLTGAVAVGGALSAAGDSTLGNLTVNGVLSVPGSMSLGNASTTYLTVSNSAWINNGTITNASTTYATLPTFWGTTGTVTNLTVTSGAITNASSTYLTVSDTAWINKLNVTNTNSTSTITGGLTVGNNAALSVDRNAAANSLFIAPNGSIGIATTTSLLTSGYGLNISTSTFLYGNQFISGGLGIGVATTTSGAIQTSGDVFVGRNLYVSGSSATIGQSSADTLVVNSSVGSNLVPTLNNWYNLGSPSFYWSNLYIDTINANNISGASTTISGTKSADFTINTDNTSVDQENMNLIFYRGMVPPNAVISWNAATSTKRFEFNQAARFFNESASTTNPVLTVQGNTGLTANLFQVLDVSTSTVLFSVNPVSQKTTMTNASTTNLSVSGNAWINSLTVSGSGGAVLLPDGTVSAPSLAFTNDTDTGLFRIGDGKMSFATNATTSLTLDNGKVIVGNDISAASYQLEVADRDAFNNTIVDEMRLSHFTTGSADNGLGTGLLFYGQDAEGSGQNMARIAAQVEQATSSQGFLSRLIFSTVGGGGLLEKMRLTGNGQLLLATTTVPSGYGANIATSTYIFGKLTVGTGTIDILSGNIISNSGQFNITNAANTALTFSTNNAERMRIDSSGNVGIGADASGGMKLVVRAGTSATTPNVSATSYNGIRLIHDVTGATGGMTSIQFGWGNQNDNQVMGLIGAVQTSLTGNGLSDLVFATKNGTGDADITERMRILANGNVGIGTTTPGSKLSVSGGVSVGQNYGVAAPSNGMIIEGNVGIGTTNPNSALQVLKSVSGSDLTIMVKNTSDTASSDARLSVQVAGASSGNPFVQFNTPGVTTWALGIDNSGGSRQFKISKGAALGTNDYLTIDTTGNVGIGTTTPGAPLEVQATNTSGSYSAKFRSANSLTSANFSGIEVLTSDASPLEASFYVRGGATAVNRRLIIEAYDNTAGAYSNVTVAPGGGNVGIGADASGGMKLVVRAGTSATTPNVSATSYNGIRLIHDVTGATGGMTSIQFGWGNQNDNQVMGLIGAVQTSLTGNGLSDLVFATKNGTGDADITERMRILANGNVGIGTTSPGRKLEISDSAANMGVRITSMDANGRPLLEFYRNTSTQIGLIQAGLTDAFGTNGDSMFVYNPVAGGKIILRDSTGNGLVQSAGNVGIGTTNVEPKLEIAAGALCVDSGTNSKCTAAGTAGDIYYGVAHANWVDIAEKYPSLEALEPGDIVSLDAAAIASATGAKPYVKKAAAGETLLGAISTQPGMVLGDDYGKSPDFSVALAGRLPMKVSLENGPIAVGDRIAVSSVAGVGKKATSTEETVGIALEAYSGAVENKILVFINLGQPQLAAKQGTIDLVTLNSDLNLNGFSILNIKSITGMNGSWKIDESGNLTVQSVNTQALTVGGGAASGVTIYDRQTGAPKCIYIEGGVIKTSDGACGATTNAGTPVTIIPASAPAPSASLPPATTTPTATTATTTPVLAATTTPVIAPAPEPVIVSTVSTSSPQATMPIATTTP